MKIRRKLISVNENNYTALKKLGQAGDSFNDVITDTLNKLKTVPRLEAQNASKSTDEEVSLRKIQLGTTPKVGSQVEQSPMVKQKPLAERGDSCL